MAKVDGKNITVKETNSLSYWDYYFKTFENQDDFTKQGEVAWGNMASNAEARNLFTPDRYLRNENYARQNYKYDSKGKRKAKKSTSWFGDMDKTPEELVKEVVKGNFLEYVKPELLTTTMDSFDALFDTIEMGGAFNKSRLIITDNPQGIFDFSLASQGLFRPPEYFSEVLKEKFPNEFGSSYLPGLVPPDAVASYKEFDPIQFWYERYENAPAEDRFKLQQRQAGVTEILKKRPELEDQLVQKGNMWTFEKYVPGLVFRTRNKKSYVMFKREGGKARMVDLYVGVGGLQNLDPEGMLARAMPLLLAARYFEMAGIRTRINAMRMYYDDDNEDNENIIAFTYTIKDYGEDLDFNRVALDVADPRWFRALMWKYTAAILNEHFKDPDPNDENAPRSMYNAATGRGITVYRNDMPEVEGDILDESFNRYRNWYFNQIQTGNLPATEVDRNLMLIGGLEDPWNSMKINKGKIIEEFYRILDTVDFQYNDPYKAAERVYKRMVETDGEDVYDYKKYVINTLRRAFSFPTSGQWKTEGGVDPDTGEYYGEQKRMDDLLNEKLEGMVEYLEDLEAKRA